MNDWRVTILGTLMGAILAMLWVIIAKLETVIKYLRNLSYQARDRKDHWTDPGA